MAPEGRQKLSTMRSVHRQRLLESKTTIPHFYLEIEVDAKPMLDLRAQLNEQLGKLTPPVKLSLNDFVLKAAAEAVRRVPGVNASFDGDGIKQFPDVQLSFAVAIAEGLITPIVREAQNKSLIQISGEAKELAGKAKAGKLKPRNSRAAPSPSPISACSASTAFTRSSTRPRSPFWRLATSLRSQSSARTTKSSSVIAKASRSRATIASSTARSAPPTLKELRELIEKPALLLL